MALIKCPECGKEISDKATACPNCGYPIALNIIDENRKIDIEKSQEDIGYLLHFPGEPINGKMFFSYEQILEKIGIPKDVAAINVLDNINEDDYNMLSGQIKADGIIISIDQEKLFNKQLDELDGENENGIGLKDFIVLGETEGQYKIPDFEQYDWDVTTKELDSEFEKERSEMYSELSSLLVGPGGRPMSAGASTLAGAVVAGPIGAAYGAVRGLEKNASYNNDLDNYKRQKDDYREKKRIHQENARAIKESISDIKFPYNYNSCKYIFIGINTSVGCIPIVLACHYKKKDIQNVLINANGNEVSVEKFIDLVEGYESKDVDTYAISISKRINEYTCISQINEAREKKDYATMLELCNRILVYYPEDERLLKKGWYAYKKLVETKETYNLLVKRMECCTLESRDQLLDIAKKLDEIDLYEDSGAKAVECRELYERLQEEADEKNRQEIIAKTENDLEQADSEMVLAITRNKLINLTGDAELYEKKYEKRIKELNKKKRIVNVSLIFFILLLVATLLAAALYNYKIKPEKEFNALIQEANGVNVDTAINLREVMERIDNVKDSEIKNQVLNSPAVKGLQKIDGTWYDYDIIKKEFDDNSITIDSKTGTLIDEDMNKDIYYLGGQYYTGNPSKDKSVSQIEISDDEIRYHIGYRRK